MQQTQRWPPQIAPPALSQPDFEQVVPLARGAFAEVYKVKQRLAKGQSAWRIVRYLPKVKSLYAFQREKDLLRYLNQFDALFPRLHEVRAWAKGYFQIFEWRGDTTLERIVDTQSPLTPEAVQTLLLQLVDSLEKVHQLGFVHGDIKPSNIVWYQDRASLIDWSQAIPAKSSYESEHMIGDLLYTPPERMWGVLNDKSDIYALGLTLYFALTGQRPYGLSRQHTRAQKLYAHQFFILPKSPVLPKPWRDLILWMTQKSLEKRPSLAQVRQVLTEAWEVPTFEESLPAPELAEAYEYPQTPLQALVAKGGFFPRFKLAIEAEDKGELAEAKAVYEELAFRGYSRAMNNLGSVLEKQQHFESAAAYYDQGYQHQNPYASYNLARLLASGKGVTRSFQKSTQLFEFAAMRGHRLAQQRLSECYQNGIGVKQDLEKAHFWALQAKR